MGWWGGGLNATFLLYLSTGSCQPMVKQIWKYVINHLVPELDVWCGVVSVDWNCNEGFISTALVGRQQQASVMFWTWHSALMLGNI